MRLLKLISTSISIKLKLQGVDVRKNCLLLGAPVISLYKGSKIIIGDNCSLTSSDRFHPVINQKVKLSTYSSDAVIIMHPKSGISGSSINCCKRVEIGENTIIGPEVLIRDNDGHIPGPNGTWPGVRNNPNYAKEIIIGKGCFIGTRATILKGCTIGDGCVVTAGSVVTKDIPAGSLAIGNPARVFPLPESLKYQEKPDNAISPN